MKKKSFFDKFRPGNSTRNEDQPAEREYVAEQLEARILYSAAPVDAAPVEEAVERSVDQGSDGEFEAIENFGGAPQVVEADADPLSGEMVTLTSFDHLTDDELAVLADAAVQRWVDSGITDEQLAALRDIEYDIVDLEPGQLGMAEGNEILIDIDATGEGWFIDMTPFEDEEFGVKSGQTIMRSTEGDAAYGMDLLTVLMHEQGHILGMEDLNSSDAENLMYGVLDEGERRVMFSGQAEGFEPLSLEGAHLMTAFVMDADRGDATTFLWDDPASWSGGGGTDYPGFDGTNPTTDDTAQVNFDVDAGANGGINVDLNGGTYTIDSLTITENTNNGDGNFTNGTLNLNEITYNTGGREIDFLADTVINGPAGGDLNITNNSSHLDFLGTVEVTGAGGSITVDGSRIVRFNLLQTTAETFNHNITNRDDGLTPGVTGTGSYVHFLATNTGATPATSQFTTYNVNSDGWLRLDETAGTIVLKVDNLSLNTDVFNWRAQDGGSSRIHTDNLVLNNSGNAVTINNDNFGRLHLLNGGQISGDPDAELIFEGNGATIIEANVTSNRTGPTTIAGGTVQLSSTEGVLGTGVVTVKAGATLDINANHSTVPGNLPTVIVEAGGAISGDLRGYTLADFGPIGSGAKVQLADGAIWQSRSGVDITTAEVPAESLLLGNNGGNNHNVTLAMDGTEPFRGVAFTGDTGNEANGSITTLNGADLDIAVQNHGQSGFGNVRWDRDNAGQEGVLTLNSGSGVVNITLDHGGIDLRTRGAEGIGTNGTWTTMNIDGVSPETAHVQQVVIRQGTGADTGLNVRADQTVNLTNARFDFSTNAAGDTVQGTVNINSGATLYLNDNLATAGTYNINDGGVLWINSAVRLEQGATINVNPGATVMIDGDLDPTGQANLLALLATPGITITFNDNAADTLPGWELADDVTISGQGRGGIDFDGPVTAAAGTDNIKIISAEITQADGDVADNRFDFDGAVDLTGVAVEIGEVNNAAVTVVDGIGFVNLFEVDPDGDVRFHNDTTLGDVTVHSGRMLTGNSDADTFLANSVRHDSTETTIFDRGSASITNDLTVTNGFVEFDDANEALAANVVGGDVIIDTSLNPNSTGQARLFVDDGGTAEYANKILDGSFAGGEVRVGQGGQFRFDIFSGAGTTGPFVVNQTIAIIGNSDNTGSSNNSQIYHDLQGTPDSGARVVHYADIQLEDGSVLGINEGDGASSADIVLRGDATLSALGEADNFDLGNVSSDSPGTTARVLSIGQTGDAFTTTLSGTVDADSTIQLQNGSLTLGATSVINGTVKVVNNETATIETGADLSAATLTGVGSFTASSALTIGTLEGGENGSGGLFIDQSVTTTDFNVVENAASGTIGTVNIAGDFTFANLVLDPGLDANSYTIANVSGTITGVTDGQVIGDYEVDIVDGQIKLIRQEVTTGTINETTDEDTSITIDVTEEQFVQQAILDGNLTISELNRFGHSVYVDGDIAVMGGDGSGDTEHILIYRRDAGGTWNFEQVIEGPDGVNAADDFGYAVAVEASTQTIAVGARLDDDGGSDRGSVYIYNFDGGTWTLSQELGGGLTAEGLDGGDVFGMSVGMDTNASNELRLVVGAPNEDTTASNSGAVYVFKFDAGGSDQFEFEQVLKADIADRNADDDFGRSVDIDGNTIVIVAEDDDNSGRNNASAGYVFQLDTATTAWESNGKLSNPLPSGNNDRSIDTAISGDRMIIGFRDHDANGSNTGVALIYTRVENGVGVADDTWVLEDAIQAEDNADNDRFGFSVDILGDTVIAGAYAEDNGGESDRGAAYIFQRDTSSATAIITGVANGHVRVNADDAAAIGVVQVNFIDTGADNSSVTTAVLNGDGVTIDVTLGHDGTGITATADDVAAAINTAAISVAAANNATITASTLDREMLGNGTAVVSATATPVGFQSRWTQQAKLIPDDADDRLDNQYFGYDVEISDDGSGNLRFMAGSPRRDADLAGTTSKLGEIGGAYIFEASESDIAGTISQTAAFEPDVDAPVTTERLTQVAQSGRNVDIAGDIAIVGAPLGAGNSQDDASFLGDRRGNVSIFQRNTQGTADLSDDTWDLIQTLSAQSEPGFDDRFGQDVAISADSSTIVVGAPFLDHNGTITNTGGVYVYEKLGDGTFAQAGFLHLHGGNVNNTDENNQMGYNVAISADGSRVVAGAYLEDTGGNNSQGAVYVLDRPGAFGSWANVNINNDSPPAGVAILTSSDGEASDQYGRDVAISEDGQTIAVGAIGDDDNGSGAGAVYIYQGATFTTGQAHVAKLTASDSNTDGTAGSNYGLALAISGDTLVVGDNGDDKDASGNPGNNRGSVYVYDLSGDEVGTPGTWAGTEVILRPSVSFGDTQFGRGVDIDGDRIVVGGNGDDEITSNSGVLYYFEFDREAGSPTENTWVERQRMTDGEMETWDTNQQLGLNAAISGRTIVGSAHLLNKTLANGTQVRDYGGAIVFELSPFVPNGGTLTVDSVTQPAGTLGDVTNNGDGTITFNPAAASTNDDLKPGETRDVSFTYTLSDGLGGTATGTVVVEVTGVNDAPAASGDLTIDTGEGANYVLTVADLTETDPDDDGADLTWTITTPPASGYLALTSDTDSAITSFTQAQLEAGEVVLVPGENAIDSFDFSLADGGEDGVAAATGTVTINVTLSDDLPEITAPAAHDVSYTDTILNGITISDPDAASATLTLAVDAGTLTVADNVINGVTAAQITDNGTATVVITASPEAIATSLQSVFSGLTYTADPGEASASRTLTITLDTIANPGGAPTQDVATVTLNLVALDPNVTDLTSTTDEDSTVSISVPTDQEAVLQATLVPDSITELGDLNRFGSAVDIDGDIAVVGAEGQANREEVRIFRRDGGGVWQLEHTLLNDQEREYDDFGMSVAIWENEATGADRLFVGSRLNDAGGTDKGQVRYYEYNTTTSTWEFVQNIQPGDGGDQNGYDVDYDGSTGTLVIGSPSQDSSGLGNGGGANDSGTIWVFNHDAGTGGNLTNTQQLKASDVTGGMQFGRSVSVDGGTIIVGAELEDVGGNNSGAAYLFALDTTGTGNWVFQTKLEGTEVGTVTGNVDADDDFGFTVDVVGDIAVVGAKDRGTGGGNRGAVFVYSRDDQGTADVNDDVWTLQQMIDSNTAGLTLADSDRFGINVDLEEDPANPGNLRLIVGANNAEDDGAPSSSGAAYIFESLAGADFTFVDDINASDAQLNAEFGRDVAVSFDSSGNATYLVGASRHDVVFQAPATNILGADYGAAYIFDQAAGSGTASETQILDVGALTTQDISAKAQMGRRVAIAGDIAVVGAPEAGKPGLTEGAGDSEPGVAFVYQRNDQGTADTSDDIWTQIQVIENTVNDDTGDFFGFGVAISGDGSTIAIGAHDNHDGGSDTGTVFVYTYNGSTYDFEGRIRQANRSNDDEFGRQLALNEDGSVLAVGMRSDDDGGSASGSVSVYDVIDSDWTTFFGGAALVSSNGQKLKPIADVDSTASDEFGRSISVSGTRIVVGAFDDDHTGAGSGPDNNSNQTSRDRGSAYVFVYDPAQADGSEWQLEQKLFASNHGKDDRFGQDVDISGNVIVIGAHQEDSGGGNAGSAYVFELGGGTWTETQRIQASDRAGNSNFGVSVAIDGDRIVVGAHNEDTPATNAGAAYVFENLGGTWTETQIISQPDGGNGIDDGANFGRDVEISGSTIIVGAPQFDRVLSDGTVIHDYGAAFIYELAPIDPDSDLGVLEFANPVVPANSGSVSVNAGQLVFDPNGDFEDLDTGETRDVTFQADVIDGQGGSTTVDITVTVTGVNDGPVATDDTFTVTEDDTGSVIGNIITSDNGNGVDSDPESHPITGVTEVNGNGANVGVEQTLASGATFTVASNGSLTFNPNGGYENLAVGQNATETFTYQISDGSLASNNATVTVTITGVNDAPTDIALDNNTVTENDAGAVIGNLTVTDVDDGDTHTFSVDDTRFEVVAGQLKLKAGESIDFEAEPTVSVEVTATDQGGTGAAYSETFVLSVTDVDASLSIADSLAQNEGNSGTTSFTFTVTRTGDTTGSASATWTVSGEGANPADEDDFGGAPFPTGTVTFADGITTQDIVINVSGDAVAESDEGFQVVLSSPVSAVFADDTGVSTILNDDAPTTVYVDADLVGTANGTAIADADEGEAGNQAGTFGNDVFATIADALAAVDSNGTIIVNSGSYDETIALNDGKTIEITGPDAAGAVTITGLSSVVGTTVIIEGNSTLTIDNDSDQTIAGVVSGSGNLAKTGSGNLTLSGANDYAGATSVSGTNAELILANNSALGAAGGAVSVANNSRITLADGVTISGESATVTGNGSDFGGAIRVESGHSAEWAGDIALTGISRLGALSGGTLTVSGTISGATLQFNGTGNGKLILSGSNTYTGETVMVRGILELGADNALPVGTSLEMDDFTVADSTRFDLNGFDQEIAGLTRDSTGGTPQVTNSSGTVSTLTVNLSAGDSYDSVISGNLNLVKTGTAVLTLSGDTTYTGTTDITGGTLKVNGTHSGGGNYTVANGASLTGSGTIALGAGAAVTATGTGEIAPGDGGIGVLTIVDDSIAPGGGVLSMELDGAANDSDVLAIDGDVDLSGVTLNVSEITTADDQIYTLLTYTGTRTGQLTEGTVPAGYSVEYDDANKEVILVKALVETGGADTGETGSLSGSANLTNLTGVLSQTGETGTIGSPVAGVYGDITIGADGSYTYTLDDARVDPLVDGDQVYDSFTVFTGNGTPGTPDVFVDINSIPGTNIGGFGGGTGFAAATWAGTGTINVVAGDLTSSNYGLTETGTPQAVQGDYGQFRQITRTLAEPQSGEVWFSFLVNNPLADSIGGLSFNPVYNVSTASDFEVVAHGTSLRIDVPGGTDANIADAFVLNQTALVVGKISVGNGADSISVWVDPDIAGGNLPTTVPTFTSGGEFGGAISTLGIVTYQNNGETDQNETGGIVDAVRLGDAIDVTGVDARTITVRVDGTNDDPAPTNLPTDILVKQDTSTGIHLNDLDLGEVDDQTITVTLTTSTGGELTAASGGGVTVGGTSTAMTLTGSADAIATYLGNDENVSYLHSVAGTEGDDSDTISVTIDDGVAAPVNAGTVNVDIGESFQEGVSPDGVYATDVTYIRSGGNAGTVLDTDPDSEVIVGRSSSAMRALLEFDLSSYAPGTTADSVELTLTSQGAGVGGGFEINLYEYGFDIDESAATWNNPGAGDGTAGGTFGTLLASNAIETTGGVQTISFRNSSAFENAVNQALASGDKTLRLMVAMTGDTTGGVEFIRFRNDEFTGDTSDRPKLTIASTPAEPVTAYQFDFGYNTVVYDGNNSPAHADGYIPLYNTTWNAFGDADGAGAAEDVSTTAILDSEGNTVNGTFLLNAGSQFDNPDRVNLNGGNGIRNDVTHTGIFDTDLNDSIRAYGNTNTISARIEGIEPGTYAVYGMLYNDENKSQVYDIGMGVTDPAVTNFDFDTLDYLATTSSAPVSDSAWVEGQNYFRTVLTITDSSTEAITFVVAGAEGTTPNPQITGMQLVKLDNISASPVINGGAATVNATVDQDNGASFSVDTIVATDADTNVAELTWTGGYAQNGYASVSGTGASPTITYTPDAGYTGADTIEVYVSDGTSVTAITVNVTVNDVQDSPELVTPIVNQVGINDGQTISDIDISTFFTDPEGDTITYSATGLPAGLTMDAAGVITGTVDAAASSGGAGGVYTVSVTAVDAAGSNVPTVETFTLAVSPADAIGLISQQTFDWAQADDNTTVLLDATTRDHNVTVSPITLNALTQDGDDTASRQDQLSLSNGNAADSYIEFTITADPGYEILLDGGSVSFDASNGQGAFTDFHVELINGGTTVVLPDATAPGTYDEAVSGLGSASAVTVRLYANASANWHDLIIDNFNVEGLVYQPEPEIDILGNGISIVDGDVTPDAADGTDFGLFAATDTPATQAFTISNTGNTDLDLTGLVSISGDAAFTILTQPAIDPVPASGSTTFVVQFDPNTTNGTHTATVTVLSDDADEGTYTFDVTAEVDAISPTPVITTPANPTNNDPFTVTIDFGETVTGFDASDITVGGGSVAGAVVDNLDGTFTATIDAAADGDITIDIAASAAQDAAGNDSGAATQLTVTVDTADFSPSITTPSNPTDSDPFEVTIDFGTDVTGFGESDIVVDGGVIEPGSYTSHGNGVFTANIDADGDGTVTVTIPAGAAQNVAGTGNLEAQIAVEVDTTPFVGNTTGFDFLENHSLFSDTESLFLEIEDSTDTDLSIRLDLTPFDGDVVMIDLNALDLTTDMVYNLKLSWENENGDIFDDVVYTVDGSNLVEFVRNLEDTIAMVISNM